MNEWKERYRKFKEIYKVPRYKALIKMGIYLVFFIFVGIVYNLTKTIPTDTNDYNDSTETTIYDEFKNGNYNFEFTLTTESEEGIKISYYEGVLLNNKITGNKKKDEIITPYYIDLNEALVYSYDLNVSNYVETNYEEFYENADMNYFDLNYIIDMIQTGNLESDEEDYKKYQINVDDEDTYIYITVSEEETFLKFVLDISNLNEFNNAEYTIMKQEIILEYKLI